MPTHALSIKAPSLDDLVFLPVTGEHLRAEAEPIRVQVATILLNMGDDWRASLRAEQELYPLVMIGSQYLERGAIADARTVFNAIITTILADYGRVRDQESEIAGIVEHCVDGLARCLATLTRASARRALIEDLFAVYHWDALGPGGYGMDTPPMTALLDNTTADERTQVAGWVLAALPEGLQPHIRRRRQAGGRFILQLRGESTLSEAELEPIYQRADLARPYLDLLLAQGRTAEAIRLVQRASQDSLVSLADTLIAAGVQEPAIAAVRNHTSVLHTNGQRTRDWLRTHNVVLPSVVDELVWAISHFNASPTIGRYKKMRDGARAVGLWPQTLELLRELDADRSTLHPIRARILADQDRSADALTELAKLSDSAWRSCAADLAEVFEVDHPARATDLYEKLAEEREACGTRAARKKAAGFRAKLANLSTRDG